MKKLLKWFGIIFAVILGIGVIAVALETPEQKAEREAQAAEEKAQREADKAEKERLKAEEQAKKDAEKDRLEAEEKERKAQIKAAEEQREADTKEDNEIDVAQDKSKPLGLGTTPNKLNSEITNIINKAFDANDRPVKIEQNNRAFTATLTNGLVWGGALNDDGTIGSTVYTVSLDGDLAAKTVYMITHMASTARVLSPSLPNEQSAEKVIQMANGVVRQATETKADSKDEVIVDGYKYSVSIMPSSSLMLGGVSQTR